MRVGVQVDECREFGLVTRGAHVEAVQQSQGATLRLYLLQPVSMEKGGEEILILGESERSEE